MWQNELLQDIKGLSGIPLFIVLIIIVFLLGLTNLGAQLIVGLILAYALATFIRVIFFRRRPDKEPYKNLIGKVDASSFPSLHAMRASVFATLLSLYFNNVLLTVVLAFAAVGVAVSRVLTKRHFVSDVVAGLIFGFFIALASVWLVARFIS